MEYYLKSADKGNSFASNSLGDIYIIHGQAKIFNGVAKDEGKAIV